MPNGVFPWREYRKWQRKPPLEEELEEERPPRVLRALELARKYQETSPFLAKWLEEIPQPPPREPTPTPTFTPAFEELTKGVGAVGGLFELGKRAAPLIAAPFKKEIRERVTKKDVLPTPEPPEGLPPSRMMEEYEKLPGVAKFFAEEAIFLPLYLAGLKLPKATLNIIGKEALTQVGKGKTAKEAVEIATKQAVKKGKLPTTALKAIEELKPPVKAPVVEVPTKKLQVAEDIFKLPKTEFETLAKQGKVAPFGGQVIERQTLNEIKAVVKGTKPIATVIGDELDLLTRFTGLTVKRIPEVVRARIRPGAAQYAVYKRGNKKAYDALVAVEKKAKELDPISLHFERGKALGYSDADIITYLSKTYGGYEGVMERAILPKVDALVDKLALFVRTLKPERVKAELTVATIRKQQAARLGAIQEQLAKGKISGEVAHKRMLGALKGEMPEARGPVSDVVFTRAEVSSLKQIIGTTNKLPPVSENRYIRLHTMQALNTLLEGKIPTERGLALLERVFGEKFVKAFIRRRTIPEKIWVGAIEAAGLIKSVRASWDISAFYRQGAVLLTAHPQQIPAALKAQIKSVFSDAQALAIHDACHATPWEGVMETAKLYRPDFWSSLAKITAREEAYVSRIARRIPGIKRSERAYIVGLNKIRTDFFGYQAEQWSKMGVKATPEDYRHLARAINILTGRGEIRNLEGALTALNAVLFSPRFQLSRIMTPTLLVDSSPLVRKMAAKVLAKFYGFWATMFGATAFLAHEDLSTDFNPLSTNFGKIRYKDTWIDPIAGYGPWFRLAARLMSSPIYAVAKTINEDDVAQFSIAAPRVKSTYSDTIREADLMRLLGTMLRTKLSPAATPIIDFMLGRTMVGKEVKRMGLEEQLMEYWSPLAIQAIIEATQEEGFVGGMVALPEFIGFGIYTIPVSEQLVSEINERYTDYRTMKTKHNELIEKGEIEKANTFAQAHPELLYGVMYGRVAKAIRNLQDQIVRIEDDEEMSSQDKEERIEALTIQIIELATGALGQEVTGEKGVPQSQPPRTPQRQPTTGTINPFLR